jgi:hypothetical protein
MTRVFAAALAALIYLPMTVQAQAGYDDQVQAFLYTSGRMILKPQGLLATQEIYTGSLNVDSGEDHWITLEGGEECALLGVCDRDCERGHRSLSVR